MTFNDPGRSDFAGLAGAGNTAPLASSTLGPVLDPAGAAPPAGNLLGSLAGGQQQATPGSGLSGSIDYLANHFAGVPPQFFASNPTSPLLSTIQGPGGVYLNVPAVSAQGAPLAGDALMTHAQQLGLDNFPSFPTQDAATAALPAALTELRRRLGLAA